MNSRSLDQTYYEILEVQKEAPHHEIVAAYARAKEAYSPDSPALYSMFTKEEAKALIDLIEEAFSVLGNVNKRREYDHKLELKSKENPSHNLPDFAPPSEDRTPVSTNDPGSISTRSNLDEIPEGFAKSRLSVYEVNPEVEDEIKAQTDVDGAFLRKIRLYKNIKLDHLSKETKIGRSYIAALEADDYEALPAAVFTRGFVVQVARILGLNETASANSYMDKFKNHAK